MSPHDVALIIHFVLKFTDNLSCVIVRSFGGILITERHQMGKSCKPASAYFLHFKIKILGWLFISTMPRMFSNELSELQLLGGKHLLV